MSEVFTNRVRWPIFRERIRQELQGDESPKARIAGFTDFAHPASAEDRLDFVRAQEGTGCEWHSSERGDDSSANG